jgi:flagellar basal-body rod protein FlgC
MDYGNAFQISAAGMRYESARVHATALNLANMDVAAGAGTAAYQPLRAVARSVAPGTPFGAAFDAAQAGTLLRVPGEVRLEPVLAAPRIVHEPGHPAADERGFVAYPGVEHASEMLTLVCALRAYEANVVAMTATKTMALKALEIAGNP